MSLYMYIVMIHVSALTWTAAVVRVIRQCTVMCFGGVDLDGGLTDTHVLFDFGHPMAFLLASLSRHTLNLLTNYW